MHGLPPSQASASSAGVAPVGQRYEPGFYVPREVEARAHAVLSTPRSPLILCGPQDVGKRTLAEHLIARAALEDEGLGQKACCLRVDLSVFEDEPGVSEGGFLWDIAGQLQSGLGLLSTDMDALNRRWMRSHSTAAQKLTRFVEERVLGGSGRAFLLIEHADALPDDALRGSFYDLLRTWVDSRSDARWERLHLVLLVSDRKRLSAQRVTSPLGNVAQELDVADFSPAELDALLGLAELVLSPGRRRELADLAGGHPRLWRRFLSQVHSSNPAEVQYSLSPEQLWRQDLLALHSRVSRSPQLYAAFRSLVSKEWSPLAPADAYALLRLGLVKEHSLHSGYTVRCPLFRQV